VAVAIDITECDGGGAAWYWEQIGGGEKASAVVGQQLAESIKIGDDGIEVQ
jgi:hypothetical protein